MKFRGVLMSPVTCPAAVSFRSGPTVKTAMLLCPRLDTYTKFPDGCRMHSAVEFPSTGIGSVESDCTTSFLPPGRSSLTTFTVESSSPQT